MNIKTKIRKPSLPVIGVACSLTILGAVAVIPKTAPIWLWTSVQAAMVVWLMTAAATGAVLWERYGPNGCRLHELEASRVVDEASVSDEGGGSR